MNANELRPLLVEYRNQVEKAWTVETAMPGYNAAAGKPHGQCGATSAWLQKRLWIDHGIKTHFGFGTLRGLGMELSSHCWLETYGYELVLDLTADQMDPDLRVVCGSPVELAAADVLYDARSYLDDLEGPGDLLRRMVLLSEAVKA